MEHKKAKCNSGRFACTDPSITVSTYRALACARHEHTEYSQQHCDYHFAEKETVAQTGMQLAPGCTASKWQSWELSPQPPSSRALPTRLHCLACVLSIALRSSPIKYLFMYWLISCTWLWLSGKNGVGTLEEMEGPCFYLVGRQGHQTEGSAVNDSSSRNCPPWTTMLGDNTEGGQGSGEL